MAVAVVVPGPYAQFAGPRSAAAVYRRRRRAVLSVLTAVVLVLVLSAGRVVANRGGAPASASTVRPATPHAAPASPGAAHVYVVQPGDTLWSIGQRFHGTTPLSDYVDDLVERNGGTHLDIAQPLALP
jgi:nucleoid-associated protein YgaU